MPMVKLARRRLDQSRQPGRCRVTRTAGLVFLPLPVGLEALAIAKRTLSGRFASNFLLRDFKSESGLSTFAFQ